MPTINRAVGTLQRNEKGPLGPPPELHGDLKIVADSVASWPGVDTSIHWSLDHSRPDGVDFYLNERELGHLHRDGSIHLATSVGLGEMLVHEQAAKPFRYQRGWVEERVKRIGPQAAIALFRRNYEAVSR